MDATDLRVFEAVARLGGMSRAAAELNTVQSNVTARIRRLEGELGTTLFERHSRGVTLTAAGQRLLPYAVQVGSLLAEARRAAIDDGTPRGRSPSARSRPPRRCASRRCSPPMPRPGPRSTWCCAPARPAS